MKNITLFKFLLLLAPIQCIDFIPNWLILFFTMILSFSIFINIHQIIFIPLIIGSSYQIIKDFGYNLQPESAISFLNLVLLMKFLSKSTEKQTHYTLGFLWIGTFALFNTNIYYLFYLIISLVIIIFIFPFSKDDLFKLDNIKIDKKFIFAILKSVPLILLLFFIFPRFYGFLPSANKTIQGQIGYSTKINNSSISNLSLSSQTAFYAEMEQIISPENLYWRGRIHNFTDGYNWRKQDQLVTKNKIKLSNSGNEIEYTLKYEQDLGGDLILLDTPSRIVEGNIRYYEQRRYKTYHTYRKNKKATIKAKSKLAGKLEQKKIDKEFYLQLPDFKPKLLLQMNKKFENLPANELISKFRDYIIKEKFVYSLNPGRMNTLNDFINKKIGYCTHYASLLGIILRLNNIPARLVSGFQGAQYNDIGKYYIIRSNDAHAWVEYFDNNQWNRVDPTSFISPNRVLLGGDQFLTSSQTTTREKNRFTLFDEARKYFNYLNYRLALFMDSFDRDSQSQIAKMFKLSLKQFYLIGLIMIAIFCGLILRSRKNKINKKLDEIDTLFHKFSKKLEKEKIQIYESDSVTIIKTKINQIENHKKYEDFLDAYQKSRYSKNKDHQKLSQLYDQL